MSMLDPSIDELQEKIRSKYTLVTLSARRAREMRDTTKKSVLEDAKALTYVGMALEEIQAEKLTVKEDE